MDARHGLVALIAVAGVIAAVPCANATAPLHHDTPVVFASPAGGDCDDLDVGVNPGAAEIAGNGIDDDCDGLADEDALGNPSPDTSDADGDTFALANGDCNDHDGAIHPGVNEIVGNFVDDDCDGLADEDASDNPSLDTVDRDGDHVPIAPDAIFADGFELVPGRS